MVVRLANTLDAQHSQMRWMDCLSEIEAENPNSGVRGFSGPGCASVGPRRAGSVFSVSLQSRQNQPVNFINENFHSAQQLLPLFRARGIVQTFHQRFELL